MTRTDGDVRDRVELDVASLEPMAAYPWLTDGYPSSDRLGVLAVRGQGGQPGPALVLHRRVAEPPVICFTSVGSEDSLCNIQQSGAFIVCTPRAWAEPVNLTGTNFPAQASEFDATGLTREPRVAVTPFRVAGGARVPPPPLSTATWD